MKCPYQDIGCWYIDDVSHECEAQSRSDCWREARSEPRDNGKKHVMDGEEEPE
jgi:hypothetical protein